METALIAGKSISGTYEEFINLARKARLTGKLGLHDSSLAMFDKCGRFREMVLHLNYENHIDRLEKQASIESDTIGCLAYQFMPGRLRADVIRTGYRCNRKESLTISVKGTTIPASGVEKPGDMWTRCTIYPEGPRWSWWMEWAKGRSQPNKAETRSGF